MWGESTSDEASSLERIKRILLLLALTYWLIPQPIQAEEVVHEKYVEPEPSVMDRTWGDEKVAYENWQKSKPKTKVYKPVDYNPCSCVSYARWRSGINTGSIGVARNHKVNSQIPKVGALAVTYESSAGHLSYVVAIDDKYIYVDEANYLRCRVTYNRAIPRNSKVIKGYYTWN